MKNVLFTLMMLLGLSLNSDAQQEDNAGYAEGIKSHHNLFDRSMKEGVAGYRIPAIITAKNGTVIAAIDERVPSLADLNRNKNINIAVRLSKDNGETWSEPTLAVDFPDGQSGSDPSLVVDGKTGDIFLFYNYMDLNKEPNVFYLHYVKSNDNGETWGEPVDITDQIAKEEWKKDFKFITSGRGVYTRNGKILHTLVNLKHGLHIFGSDDHGKSWYLIDTPIKPADESKIIELSNGNWMINSRVNSRTDKFRYIHISSNKGKTWKTLPDKKLVDPGCNGSIISYSCKRTGGDKNRLLFSNANSAKGRENLTVRVSYDDGKTWKYSKVIYSGPSAYSDLTVLPNGDIAVFFEKGGYKSNEVVIFSLEWLTDGKDKYVAK